MKINKISWKNIYSYGNKEESLDFTGEGLWQLFGKSGAGKSTVIQMPQLLLYGKTMAKMNKGDIANRTNKHGVVTGEIVSGGDVYVITRKFDPDDLELFKNEKKMDFPTKVEAQKYIETVVLGDLPLDIFKNVLTLSLNNFTSFITISAADKRKIIDNIFSMDIINDCMELLKQDKKDISAKINSANGGISALDGSIFRAKELLRTKESALELDEETASKEESIIAAIDKVDKKTPELIEKNNTYTEDYCKLVGEKSSLDTERASKEIELRDCQKKIDLFKQDRCPTCGAPFKTPDFEKILSEYEDLKVGISEAINNKIVEINEKVAEINAIADKSKNVVAEIGKLTDKRKSLEEWLKKINNYKSAKSSINETETEIQKLETDKKKIQGESNKNVAILDDYALLESVYSDNGVKKYHREKYIPTLNAELKSSLKFIDFPYQLSFDTDFNAHLMNRGETVNIESLSAGERKKVDLCVLCSLIRIIKQKYPTLNIIGLDETISSLDYDSSVNILRYLKKTSEDLGVNILIVSHTTLDESLFDKRIFVDKVDGFSKLSFC